MNYRLDENGNFGFRSEDDGSIVDSGLNAPGQNLEGLYGDCVPFMDKEFVEAFTNSGLPVHNVGLVYEGWKLAKRFLNKP